MQIQARQEKLKMAIMVRTMFVCSLCICVSMHVKGREKSGQGQEGMTDFHHCHFWPWAWHNFFHLWIRNPHTWFSRLMWGSYKISKAMDVKTPVHWGHRLAKSLKPLLRYHLHLLANYLQKGHRSLNVGPSSPSCLCKEEETQGKTYRAWPVQKKEQRSWHLAQARQQQPAANQWPSISIECANHSAPQDRQQRW